MHLRRPVVTADEAVQALAGIRVVCPVHAIPDCSPLLNGCPLASHIAAFVRGPLLASPELAAVIAAAKGDALREAATRFEQSMTRAWGGDRGWFTSGTHVARLSAEVLRAWADEVGRHGVTAQPDTEEGSDGH